jgi:hypothetical protein
MDVVAEVALADAVDRYDMHNGDKDGDKDGDNRNGDNSYGNNVSGYVQQYVHSGDVVAKADEAVLHAGAEVTADEAVAGQTKSNPKANKGK